MTPDPAATRPDVFEPLPRPHRGSTSGGSWDPAFDRASQRRLRVLVDTARLTDSPALGILLDLGSRESLHLVTTDPADGLPSIRFGELRADRDVIEFEIESVDGARRRGIPLATRQLEHADLYADELGMEREEARRQWLLARAGAVWRSDALVAQGGLFGRSRLGSLISHANLMSVDHALHLVGLFLRARSDYTYLVRGAYAEYLPPERFFTVCARHLLPGSWRVSDAASLHFGTSGDGTVIGLSDALLGRITRALRVRDRLLRQFQLEPSDETPAEILLQFESLLWSLSGAFDAAARIAHVVYALGGSLRQAGWRRDWWGKLNRKAPTLAAYTGPGSEGEQILRAIAALRNTIHGQRLGDEAFITDDSGVPTVVSAGVTNPILVPQYERGELLEALEELGDPRSWGIDEHAFGVVHIVADAFAAQLLPRAVRLLDTLMTKMELARLIPEDEELATGPPTLVPVYQPVQRERFLGLLGLA